MAQITLVHNAFDINEKTIHDLPKESINKPLYEIIPQYINEYKNKDYDVIFIMDGSQIELLEAEIVEDTHLVVIPIPAGGGGGKNILRIVAMIAFAVVAAPYLMTAMGATATATGWAIGGSTLIGSLAYAGVMIVGGLLINAIIPVQAPKISTDLENVSPTYAFGGGSNANVEGTALPIVLGKAQIMPPIINSYLSLKDDNQYYNALYALNDGLFDKIHKVTVNDQVIEDYENIDFEVRYGHNDQPVMSNFSDDITTYSLNRTMDDTTTVVGYTTSSNAVNAIQLGMVLPKGLFKINDDGSYVSQTITFKARYRRVGTTTWYGFQNTAIASYNYAYISQATGNITNYTSYNGLTYNGLTYIGKFPVYTTTIPNITITGTYKTTKRLVYTISNLEPDEYEIEIYRTSAYSEDTKIANSFGLEYINEVTYDDLAYPNTGLLGLRAMATDQLSGSAPRVSILMENITMKYWEDGVLYLDTTKRLDNPAWASYYILRKANFTDINIDTASFEEWATFCTSKNYTCNLVLDQVMELPEILNMISALGRGKVIQRGTKWAVIIDKVVSAPTQSFLFTSGNIVENSFTLDYIPYTERSNVVEVTYYDENNNYEATSVQAQSPNFDAASGTLDEYKTTVSYYGCTNKQMASNYAQFLINNNRYISETVSFTAGIDSIACTVGDIIKVGKKYLANNLADGRIISDDSGVITLDQEVELEIGKNYSIDIRKSSTDEIFTFDIVNTGVTTNQVELINPTTNLEQYDVFTIGEKGFQSNLYRVLSITRDSDITRKISAIEYIPQVYDDILTIPDEEIRTIGQVSNIVCQDTLVKNIDGSISEYLDISWQGRDPLALTNKIYINGQLVGTSQSNSFLWTTPTRGITYTIKVNTLEKTHTYLGLSIPPDPITNLQCTESGNIFTLTWDYIKPIDFLEYRIYYNGHYEASTTANSHSTPLLSGLDTKKFSVYAVDTLNNLSTEVYINKVASRPDPVSNIQVASKLDTLLVSWSYTKPADFKKFVVVTDVNAYYTEDLSISIPLVKTINLINIYVLDSGGNSSQSIQTSFTVPYLNDLNTPSSFFDGTRLAYTWDKDESSQINYIIKKGTDWNSGVIVKITSENIFYPPSVGEYMIKKYYKNLYDYVLESENYRTIAVEGDIALKANIIAELHEADTNWTGTKTHLEIHSDSNPDYDNTLTLSNGYLSGTYEVTSIVELTSAQVCGITLDFNLLVSDTENYIDTVIDFDAISSFDGNISNQFTFEPEISISMDGTTWSDWKRFEVGNQIGLKFKFRITLSVLKETIIPYLQDLIIIVDMPDRLDKGSIQTSTSTYDVTFTPDFNIIPQTVCTIVNAQNGDDLILTNESESGFTVGVKNNGSYVARTINYFSQGY